MNVVFQFEMSGVESDSSLVSKLHKKDYQNEQNLGSKKSRGHEESK